MTTQKAQRKIKSSTVAITVLSILLAIALVSTIVLAAFTANRTATTTITFGGGLQIEVSGAVEGDISMASSGAITIATEDTYTANVNISSISVKPNQAAYVAFGMKGGVVTGTFSLEAATANASEKTVTWNIKKSDETVGTIVVKAGSTFTLATATGDADTEYVAYANISNVDSATVMIESITVTATSSVNDLAGLQINSLITAIGAATTDGTNLDAVKAMANSNDATNVEDVV